MHAGRKIRIAIVDRGFISPYFGEFFSILNANPQREYVVFHGDPPSRTGLRAAEGPFSFPTVEIRNIELFKTAIYQPLVRKIAGGDFDAVILGHELKFLSNWIVGALCKAQGIPVILWGFGYHAPRGIGYRARSSRLWNTAAASVKKLIARTADGYLAYTERGAQYMRALNVRGGIFVVRPSVNVREQIRLHERFRDADRAELRRQLGLRPGSVVFLYIGRLVDAKNADGLLDLVSRLNASPGTRFPVEARIIGGGERLEPLRERAKESDAVEVTGEIYDQEDLARYLAASDALVLPGAAGITVTHAFAHGTPVLMRKSPLHSPEADYVVDGQNSLVSGESMDDLFAVAQTFVNSPDLRARLASGALRTRELFSMEHMADQFHQAVDAVLERRRKP